MASASLTNLPSLDQRRDTQFAHCPLVVSFTSDQLRSTCSLIQHRDHRLFWTSANTSLSLSSTPFSEHPSSAVSIQHPPYMAGNADSAHRRSSSVVSSVDEAASHDGTVTESPASASTVPTARSTPFIGPQNHPGIPAQHHSAALGQSLNDDVSGTHASQLGHTAFASQIEEVQTQIRLLGSNGPHQPASRNSRYRYVVESFCL